MKEEILRIIYTYYPKFVESNTEEFINSEQYTRLRASVKIAEENIRKWNIFLDKLNTQLAPKYKAEDWTQLFNNDACYTCRVLYSYFDNVIVDLSINVSIISNYFSIYVSTTKKENGCYSIPEIAYDLKKIDADLLVHIRKTIYASFPNYEEFPVSLVNETIPDISIGNKFIGEATFFNCIFTTHVW